MINAWGPGLFENELAVELRRRWDAADPDPTARLKLHFDLWQEHLPHRGTVEWRQFLFALAALEFDFGSLPDETSMTVLAEIERGDDLQWWREHASAEESRRRDEVLESLRWHMTELPDYSDQANHPRLREL